jgi:lysozyme
MSLSNDSLNKITVRLMDDEGFSGKVYTCPKGFLTIGFGFNLTNQQLPMSIAVEWLHILINKIQFELEKNISFWSDLNEARKCVLINMAYQMGIGGLLAFHDMLKALERKDYAATVAAMKGSVWYRDFTARASRLIKIMKSGEF